jgi:hypothetical protein
MKHQQIEPEFGKERSAAIESSKSHVGFGKAKPERNDDQMLDEVSGRNRMQIS